MNKIPNIINGKYGINIPNIKFAVSLNPSFISIVSIEVP